MNLFPLHVQNAHTSMFVLLWVPFFDLIQYIAQPLTLTAINKHLIVITRITLITDVYSIPQAKEAKNGKSNCKHQSRETFQHQSTSSHLDTWKWSKIRLAWKLQGSSSAASLKAFPWFPAISWQLYLHIQTTIIWNLRETTSNIKSCFLEEEKKKITPIPPQYQQFLKSNQ